MKKIIVVVAIIQNDEKILCVQRPAHKFEYISHKWEFPGGKVEEGETLEAALKREILEELSLQISVEEQSITVVHQYPDFELEMHSFLCRSADRNLELHEHIDLKWLSNTELDALDWAAADLPIVEYLKSDVDDSE